MKVAALIAVAAIALMGTAAEASRSRGGHYVGGTGSHHKGGHYVNPRTGNHYTKRR